MFQWTQAGILEILVRNNEKSFMMKMITDRTKLLRKAVVFPSLGVIQNTTGQGPQQHDLDGPALAGWGRWTRNIQKSFPT